jgi:cation diffusion facilitator CzcD-associated flavoprotein CzcO
MANPTAVVIIGGGLGGAKAAEALREKDFDGDIVLSAEEEQLPYERPPLSKEFLAGKKSLSDFTVHDAEYTELPYFFTDQYDLGMEYAGHAPTYDRVVFRGDVDGREFVAFWLDADNRVLAGMNVEGRGSRQAGRSTGTVG